MNSFDLIEIIGQNNVALSLAALIIALGSMLLAWLSYRQGTEEQILRRQQNSAMRTLAAQAAVSFDQFLNIAQGSRAGAPLDAFVLESASLQARRLEASLDAALALGLIREIIGDRSNAVTYHTAFQQSLVWASLNGTNAEAWLKQHYMFGLYRLVDSCLRYHTPLFPAETHADLRKKVDRLAHEAYAYMDKP